MLFRSAEGNFDADVEEEKCGDEVGNDMAECFGGQRRRLLTDDGRWWWVVLRVIGCVGFAEGIEAKD